MTQKKIVYETRYIEWKPKLQIKHIIGKICAQKKYKPAQYQDWRADEFLII